MFFLGSGLGSDFFRNQKSAPAPSSFFFHVGSALRGETLLAHGLLAQCSARALPPFFSFRFRLRQMPFFFVYAKNVCTTNFCTTNSCTILFSLFSFPSVIKNACCWNEYEQRNDFAIFCKNWHVSYLFINGIGTIHVINSLIIIDYDSFRLFTGYHTSCVVSS